VFVQPLQKLSPAACIGQACEQRRVLNPIYSATLQRAVTRLAFRLTPGQGKL
jgi:hypothetical protein